MALTAATRVAVITRRGHATIGLAQSPDEADRWTEDAIRYRAAGAMDRAIVSINAPPPPERPAIPIRTGTPYERLRDWLAAPASPNEPAQPAARCRDHKAAGQKLRENTLIALRTGLIVTLTGPGTDGAGPSTSSSVSKPPGRTPPLNEVALVMHVPDRLSPWIAVNPPNVDVQCF